MSIASAVDLTFATVFPRGLLANVKSKTSRVILHQRPQA
jgi:hypothetical protein